MNITDYTGLLVVPFRKTTGECQGDDLQNVFAHKLNQNTTRFLHSNGYLTVIKYSGELGRCLLGIAGTETGDYYNISDFLVPLTDDNMRRIGGMEHGSK